MNELAHIFADVVVTVVTILVGASLKTKIDLPTYQAFTREAYARISELEKENARKDEKIKNQDARIAALEERA